MKNCYIEIEIIPIITPVYKIVNTKIYFSGCIVFQNRIYMIEE